MTHLVEGTIVALRDGIPVDAETERHVEECSLCQTELVDARQRADVIADALSSLDEPIGSSEAKAALRARLDAGRSAPRASGYSLAHLGRAATVLLVAAGAAYALPGSPMRGWLSTETVESPTQTNLPASQEAFDEGGIEVAVTDGGIEVLLSGAGPGTSIEVLWSDGPTARISAAPGSSFTFGAGRAEAMVAPGPVRVELPRSAERVRLEVDGRTLLRRTSSGLEVLEPVVEQTEAGIRFLTPER